MEAWTEGMGFSIDGTFNLCRRYVSSAINYCAPAFWKPAFLHYTSQLLRQKFVPAILAVPAVPAVPS